MAIPTAGPEQVLVRIEACGLCHNDIHAAPVLGGLTVKGSIVGTHHDLEEVFELHRRGHMRVERVERELDEVSDAIDQVLDGSAPASRMVFRMADVPTGASESALVAAPA